MNTKFLPTLCRVAPILVAGFVLVSCSGEPSASDIEAAINKAVDQQMKQAQSIAAGIGGNNATTNRMIEEMAISITDFDKIGCTADGEKAYRCDVRFKVSGGPLKEPPREVAQTVRVLDTDDGWVLMK